MPRRLGSQTTLLALAGALLLHANPAAARAWVKGDVLLNVRTGPGPEHRAVGAITTGDPVEILEQADGWTHIRSDQAGEGWIPAGFLQDEPPAVVQLAQVASEASKLRARVDELTAEAERLRAEHAKAEASARDQAQEIERLSSENAALHSEVIWPVLVTGASILLTGGMLGAWMARGGARRNGQRVRL